MLHWHPSLRLPGWSRRLVLAALALCVCTTCFVRLCLLAGPGAGALQSLQARNIRQPRWTLAGLPLWTRKTRVAVLHQGDASSDDAFIAIAYHLAHEPDVELTLFHGPFAHGNDETISRFWKGGYRKVEDHADPFAGQDTVVVASSQLSESLKAVTPALARHPKLRLVLLVPDAAAFDPLAPSTGPPAPGLPAEQLQAALSLARARRLRFLVPSSGAQAQLAAHLALVDGSRATEWLGRTGGVECFFAYVPTPRVARRYDVNRFKSWAKVGVLVPPTYHTGSGHGNGNGNGTDAPKQAVTRLLEEVQQAVQAAPASWGYRAEQGSDTYIRASTRDARPLEVHLFSLQSLESLRFAGVDVRVPDALGGIVRVHGGLDAQEYHRLVSTMDVLVPVDGSSLSLRSPTLALSARVPVLLPERAADASQLSRPALIAYPDEMPVMRALQSVRASRDPRGKMAWMARTWDRLDTPADWQAVGRAIRDENRGAWTRLLLRDGAV